MDTVPEENCEKSRKIAADDPSLRTMDSLPFEIALDILSRLPITSLMSVKFVCRSWKNLVCDPVLVRMHFCRMSQRDPCLILHCNFPIQSQVYFVQNSGCIEDDEEVKRIILPSMPDFIVGGSCNGLICLYDLLQRNVVYTLNPFTRNFSELPRAEQFSEQQTVSFGFGFLPTTKQYKVVRIVYYRNEEGNPLGRTYVPRSNVQIFNLGTSSWRNIGQISYQLQRKPSHALVNGRLHWMTIRHMQQPLRMIVSFDLADEQFRIVPEPNFILFRKRRSHLVILRGCLSLASYTRHLQLDIWIMKEYDVKESWTKAFSIGAFLPKDMNQNADHSFSISEPYINPNQARVLCMLENGEILLDFRGRALLLYEPKSSTFKQLKYPGLPNYFEPIIHIGSLNRIENITGL